jgi:hypothetical protein
VDTPPSSHFDLEILAAELRRHSADLSLYAGFLLNVLSAALPGELIQVRREGRWSARLSGRDPAVLGISVLLGDHRYELDRKGVGAPAVACVRHESVGVVLSTRQVSVDEWSHEVAGELVGLAKVNAAAAAALQRLTAP